MNEKKPIAKIKKKKLETIEGRKVIEVPYLVYADFINLKKEIHEEYENKLMEYHGILKEWLENFETKIGKIDKVYVQGLTEIDENTLKKMESTVDKEDIYYKLINDLVDKGAQLQATENIDLIDESLAWLEQIQSVEVMEVDYQLFMETIEERDKYIVTNINETLNEGETALLLIGIEHKLNFPNDIEIIRFRPPVIDDIIKLFQT